MVLHKTIPFVLGVVLLCGNAQAQTAAEALGESALQRLMERTAPLNVAEGATMPHFIADAAWPLPLPNNWINGQIAGVHVDQHDHIWVLQRARSLSNEEAGLMGPEGDAKNADGVPISAINHLRPNGPITDCCTPAPAVMEFDQEGNLLRSWGGPSDPGFLETKCRKEDGCYWPANEHGIYVDHNDFIYIGSNGNGQGGFPWAGTDGPDGHILKFTMDGEFVLQIGMPGNEAPVSNDTDGGINGTPQLFRPADMTVDPETNYLWIADGYGNNRVVVVDAETGKYIGHFGAYGQNPVDDELADNSGIFATQYDGGDAKPKFFRNPVHCVKIANDGKVYVCDRGNNRFQVFDKNTVGQACDNPEGVAGQCGFIEEQFASIKTRTTIPGTAVSVNFSNDEEQSCLYVGDNSNMTIYVINRSTLGELGQFGQQGRQVGEFYWLHNVATDSAGNIYTGEVDTGRRLQKFIRYGETGCSGEGHEIIGGVLGEVHE